MPAIAIHNLTLEVIKTNGELKTLEAEQTFLEKALAKDNLTPEEITKADEKRKELKIKLIQLDSKNTAENFLLAQTKKWRLMAIIGIAVGFILVMLGFRLWYERVQKYQDVILKNEAGSALEAEKKDIDLAPDNSTPPTIKDS